MSVAPVSSDDDTGAIPIGRHYDRREPRAISEIGVEGLMKLVTAIIEPSKVEQVKDVLKEAGVRGLTVSDARGFGRSGGKTDIYRGSEFTVDFAPRVRLEVVVAGRPEVETVVNVLAGAVRRGQLLSLIHI